MTSISACFRRILLGTIAVVLMNAQAIAEETFKGVIVAKQVGKVSSQLTGERSVRVQELNVRVGDRVKKGDLIAKLSTEQLEADRKVADASHEEAKALVAVAESRVKGAQLVLGRQERLRKSTSFQRSAFEDAEVALQTAEASLQSARGVAARRKAEVDRIALEISLADIIAPYDGIITNISANVGAAVTQRNPDLVQLLDLSRVEIEVAVPQSKLALFSAGKIVKFNSDNGAKGEAKVRAIMSVLAKNKRDRVVRLTLAEPGKLGDIHDQEAVTITVGK
ncbi:MAG: efflux RND transporter periplasmic adaptor subunit [Pseudomonadota bacterium]